MRKTNGHRELGTNQHRVRGGESGVGFGSGGLEGAVSEGAGQEGVGGGPGLVWSEGVVGTPCWDARSARLSAASVTASWGEPGAHRSDWVPLSTGQSDPSMFDAG